MGAGIRSLVVATAALLLAGALAVPGEAKAQGGGAAAPCPDTFEVLHDDTIGALLLPRGAYTITLLDQSALTCADAADLLRQFLEDFDGRLPRPWVVNVIGAQPSRAGAGVGRLQRGARRNRRRRWGRRRPPSARVTACPGTFQVLHNDRIGTFATPEGPVR